MKNDRVLVTGAGGGVGQSIIKALDRSELVAVAADSSPLAAGLYGADSAYLVPEANCDRFLSRIIEICHREECRLIFPGIEPELPVFARAANDLRAQGIICVVSSPEVVALCDDKLATAEFLRDQGFAAPITFLLSEYEPGHLPFPLVLKPRRGGARSQGVFLISADREFSFRRETLDCCNYVAQEYISGEEFTCGTITFDGHCYGVIAMLRELRDGDTYKAFVAKESAIGEHVRAVAERLRPFGPCNFQLRIKNGKPCIFEINARCSGTTACRAIAGFNEPLMCAEYLLHNHVPRYEITPMSFLRYWNEMVVPDGRIAELREAGVLEGDRTRL